MTNKTALSALRKPFPDNLISKFPPNAGQKAGVDFVNHAVVTDRLLEVDPEWTWEFHTADGLPAIDEYGGIWIKLTIAGVTRIGYGDRGNSKGADAIKAAISDAIKNAAMRFGVALDLWSKLEIHELKVPGSTGNNSKNPLTEVDLKLIDALVDHRAKHMKFDAAAFAKWVTNTFKCESYDKVNRNALPDIVRALTTPAKGAQWPEGESPSEITMDQDCKDVLTKLTKKGE